MIARAHSPLRLDIFFCCFLIAAVNPWLLAVEQQTQTNLVEQISRMRVFEEPLIPIGGQPSEAENRALLAAVKEYSARTSPDDFTSLTSFLDGHPRSPWQSALLTGLGLEYYNTAHYSKALAAWSQAWALSKDATDTRCKAIADRAVGELAYMYGRLGRMQDLEALLKSVDRRVLLGSATEKLSGAREGLWNMQNRPEVAFRCGPLALLQIQRATMPSKPADMIVYECASTQRGMSLPQVAAISEKIGLNYQMAFREQGGEFVVPSVVHWKLGHYAAIIRKEGDKYLLQDPTFLNDVWATLDALEAESSGYFLIPSGALAKGWRTVAVKEGEKIWGKGNTQNKDPGPHGPPDPKTDDCSGGGGGGGGLPIPNDGMAGSSVHLMLVNLNLTDTPVGYSPPVGPAVGFTVRYNHRDAFQPGTFTYANFGPKWTCDWISYITDNPQNTLAGVSHYLRGGGTRNFSGFNTNSQTYNFQQYDQTLLRRTSPASYEMVSRDGSKKVFGRSDGSVGTSRKIFLTQIVDPLGNTVTLNYDSNLRLTNIVDAIGQATTLTYSTNDIYKITRVTDPFGRFATFDYDQLGRLTNITDVIGLQSRFVYEDIGDYVNALITPYGTNTFLRGESGTTRWLERIFPDGSRDRVEFNQSTNLAVGFADPAGSVPQGMNTGNNYLWYRNTYYWSRTACASSYGDYSKAKVYHWLHTEDINTAAGILESIKEPLEGRVWYDYGGQSNPIIVGTNNRPTHVGRVLDDGSTQLYTYAYNGFGNVTQTIDPIGRAFSYIYDTNGIDLLEVRMTRAGKNELLSKVAYNAQHLPLTTTGADGQTTTNTYNARGQLLTTTNPKGETTTYTYNTNGYLAAVDGPLPGTNDTSMASYDAFGRLRTTTNIDGYITTADYDAMDRITKITLPDSTFYQVTYDRLEPAILQDRAGRQTIKQYDALGNLITLTDPLGRITRFEWCNCGGIKSLTDPMNRTTVWETDVQGREVSKKFGDGSTVSYRYDAAGRLSQVVDEKLQVKQFTYNRDDTLRSVTYQNAAVPTPAVTYTYDPDYLRSTSMTDGLGTTLYTYAPIAGTPAMGAGQLASIDGPYANDTITYTYDQLGRRASTAINGMAQAMNFDEAGRLIGQTNALGAFAYTHDGSSSRVLAEQFPNGLTTSNTFGNLLEDFRLQQATHQVGGIAVSKFNYAYDHPKNRITTWSQQVGVGTPDVHNFGYDAANRLLSDSVTNSGSPVNAFAYDYDPADNRLMDVAGTTTNVATYNALNQLAISTSPGTARTNEWDAAGRLVAVNAGSERTELTYDGSSRLASIRHLTNGVEASFRRFIWCGQMISEERDALGAVVTKRYFDQGMRIETGPDAGSYFYTRDHLGSVRELIDANGVIRARYAYDPYGRKTKTSGDLDADFGFAAMFSSEESGLSHTWWRAYDPHLGQWLSRDPLSGAEIIEGPNLYAYVGGDPINHRDPLGLSKGKKNKRPVKKPAKKPSNQCMKLLDDWLLKWSEHQRLCKKLEDDAYNACQNALQNGKTPTDFMVPCSEAVSAAQKECDKTEPGIDEAWDKYQHCIIYKKCDGSDKCIDKFLDPFMKGGEGLVSGEFIIQIGLPGGACISGK